MKPLILTFSVLVLLVSCTVDQKEKPKPNIVLIALPTIWDGKMWDTTVQNFTKRLISTSWRLTEWFLTAFIPGQPIVHHRGQRC